jgi:predicted CXXCH cytochrome family protein
MKLRWLALALVLVAFAFGCEDDDDNSMEPEPSVRILDLYAFRDSITIGGSVTIVVEAEGENRTTEWTANMGSFTDDEGDTAVWKAPDEPALVRITAIVSNPDETDARSVIVKVGPYDPRAKPFYLGASTCGECHGSDPEFTLWTGTDHASSFESVVSSGLEEPLCYLCHTVGFADLDSLDRPVDNGGYDETPLHKLEGVQCESCHGPLGDSSGSTGIVSAAHTMGEDPALRQGRDLYGVGTLSEPEGCGRCHVEGSLVGGHQDYAGEWLDSGHSVSNSYAGVADDPSCTPCHTAQGYLDAFVRMTGASTYGDETMPVNCIVCHDPHDPTYDGQLRAASADAICADCHTSGDVLPSGELHHPELDILLGRGAVEYDGVAYESTGHAEVTPTRCASCHILTRPFSTPTEPAVTGHDMVPQPKNCVSCHPGATGIGSVGDLPDLVDARAVLNSLLDQLLGELEAATAEDSLTQAFQDAESNYQLALSDASRGAHNYLYVKSVLEASIEDFEPGGVIRGN